MSKPDTNSNSIDFERSTYEHGAAPYKDPQVLERLYWDEQLSLRDIGEEFDINVKTVKYWMDKLDIETRSPAKERDASISRTSDDQGRVLFFVPDDEGGQIPVYLHQIVALEAFDLTEVFNDDTHVHHRLTGAPVIDVVENLEVLSVREHISLHAGGAGHEQPENIVDEITRGNGD